MNKTSKPRFPAGDTFERIFNIVNDLGVPVSLAGATVRWTMVINEQRDEPILDKFSGAGVTHDPAIPGEVRVSIEPLDTLLLLSDDYWEQLRITFPNGVVTTPYRGWLTILPTVA